MRGELSNQLANVVKDLIDDGEDINTYVCKFSTGMGKWVDTPWAGIRRVDAAKTFEEGIYVDYGFNDDFKTLRFSILQGINNASHKQRMDIFKKLIPLIEIPEDFNIEEENPDIHFFRKNYDLENLNEEEMKNDLKLVLDVYKDLIPKYKELNLTTLNEHPLISTEEWRSVLKNDILDTTMIEILKIIYESDNHAATTGEISSIRASLGFKDEKSYNRLIVVNSKKVKEFLNDKPIFNEDGSEEYWSRFFDGANVNGAFQFQIKDELAKALEIYFGGCLMKEYASFYDYLIEKGYYFDKETVENYLLSLKVKPFVILTGNSGTGKTKLSQLFAKYLEKNNPESELNNKSDDIKKSYKITTENNNECYEIEVNSNDFQSFGALAITKYVEDILPLNEYQGRFEGFIDDIPTTIGLNIVPYLRFNKNFFSTYIEPHMSENKSFNIKIKIDDMKNFIKSPKFEGTYDFTFKIGSFPKHHIKHMNKEDSIRFFNTESKLKECEVIFDGNPTSAKFYISDTLICLKSDKLESYYKVLAKKDKEETFNMKLDLDSFKPHYPNLESIKTEVTVGKSAKSGGWSLNKKDISELLSSEDDKKYMILVDGVPAEGDLKLNPRLFYRSDELKRHLEELAKENPNQKVSLEIITNQTPDKLIYSSNYKIIPVGANWTENRNIVGYYNVITDEYQSTPAYDLIKYANTDLDNPYFLILDEMNLSHVERYFADFLSAIESRETIPLYGNEEDLEIPSNLFIIGTVNVDETTYMFSPKVLDRANTIEFDTYSAKNYMLGEFNTQAPSGDIKYLENPLSGSEIREMDINQLKDLFEGINSEFWNTLSDEIFKFQEILKKSNFDFGFRVINEIIRFMYVAWVYEGKPKDWKNWNRYFDAQIKQKMLPKLHGSERAIGETLEDLFNACFLEDSGRTFYVETSYKYPQSAKKLKEMKEALNKQRYVSFIN